MAEAQRGPIAVSERCHRAAQLELLLEVEAERQSREVEEAIAAEEANDHHILSHPHQCISMQLFPTPIRLLQIPLLCFTPFGDRKAERQRQEALRQQAIEEVAA